eukprot:scaffold22445_cov73-Phaeocystis_antarctica.AAC.8
MYIGSLVPGPLGEMSKALGSDIFGSKWMYVPSSRRCAESDMSAVHTPTALVKKQRLDCERISLPPGRSTRAT